MAKGKKATKAEAEAPVETPTPATPPEAPAEPGTKITQKEAVKQAIAAGADQPVDGIQFVKSKFDIDLSNAAFSTLKSLLKKEEGGGEAEVAPKTEKRKAGRPPAAPVQAAAARTTGNGVNGGNGSPAELAMAVKQLVAQHGAKAIVDMAKVFES